jgi:hypothetical protein
MRPTLLEGDVVLVDRLAYDLKLPLTDHALARLADPQRGDVVTFSSPADGTRLIKRIVAVPGDVVELRDGVLVVNGAAARYDNPSPAVETLGPGLAVHALQATETVAGHSRRGAATARRHRRAPLRPAPAGRRAVLHARRQPRQQRRLTVYRAGGAAADHRPGAPRAGVGRPQADPAVRGGLLRAEVRPWLIGMKG